MKIIGLCGYGRVGKDAAASAMKGWKRFAFADALKWDVSGLLDAVGCRLDNPEHKALARPMLVGWGATARAFQPNYWIDRMFSAVNMWQLSRPASGDQRIVITDVRYPNEVRRILDEGGQVVRIHRPGIGPANEEEARSILEIERDFCLPRIENDSTPEELGRRVLLAAGEVAV